MASRYRKPVLEHLSALGVRVGSSDPWDIHVHRERFFRRAALGRDLGLAESYMDGDWDCERLDELTVRLLRHGRGSGATASLRQRLDNLAARLVSRWGRGNVFRKVAPHYDLGNDFFEQVLDRDHMAYTCGYWRNGSRTLEEAQGAKLDLICRKIGLREGMTVLDIGCGWGPFARFAAERYGASVTGVTLSRSQVELGRQRCRGLPVELRVEDYRDVEGSFDRVVSIGCLEHVGHKHHRTFFRKIYDSLKDGGCALVHSFGVCRTQYQVGGFYDKYVFPLVNLPSWAQIGRAIDGLFVVEDVHNFGPDYDPTLLEWNRRFQAAWPQLEPKYGGLLGGRFKRMFEFYLLATAGFMRSRTGQIWQTVLTKPGTPQPDCRVQ